MAPRPLETLSVEPPNGERTPGYGMGTQSNLYPDGGTPKATGTSGLHKARGREEGPNAPATRHCPPGALLQIAKRPDGLLQIA